MRYLSALTVLGLMAMDAAQPRTPLNLAPRAQPPAPPKSNRQAELTARADRRRAREALAAPTPPRRFTWERPA